MNLLYSEDMSILILLKDIMLYWFTRQDAYTNIMLFLSIRRVQLTPLFERRGLLYGGYTK